MHSMDCLISGRMELLGILNVPFFLHTGDPIYPRSYVSVVHSLVVGCFSCRTPSIEYVVRATDAQFSGMTLSRC